MFFTIRHPTVPAFPVSFAIRGGEGNHAYMALVSKRTAAIAIINSVRVGHVKCKEEWADSWGETQPL